MQTFVLLVSKYTLIIVAIFVTQPAWALQPLDAFLQSASKQNLDVREAQALVEQRAGEHMQNWGKLLPQLQAKAWYTRNQQEIAVTFPVGPDGATKRAVFNPLNQLDATLTATLTLIDLGRWTQTAASRVNEMASARRLESEQLEVERQVTRAYYTLVASEALVTSAQRNLGVTQDNDKLNTQRAQAGLASELELKRSQAEVERALQDLADAELNASTARQNLYSLAMLTPDPGGQTLTVTLEEEAPLEKWNGALDRLPSVRAAQDESDALNRGMTAAWLALMPTANVAANQRYTNAVGFSISPFWSVIATAQWNFDVGSVGAARAQAAQAETARIRAERTRIQARDTLFNAWQQVRAQVQKSKAARASLSASALAAKLARDRQQQGRATQLDVLQADRDQFTAEVSTIQADADLIYARALLRLSAGESLRKKEDVR